MKYLYYPGCSLEGTALEYNLSTQAFMSEIGADLVEIDDWTCCGASAAEARVTSTLLSVALTFWTRFIFTTLRITSGTNTVSKFSITCFFVGTRFLLLMQSFLEVR